MRAEINEVKNEENRENQWNWNWLSGGRKKKINIPLARWIKKRHKSPISAMTQANQHRSRTHKNKDNKDTLKTILHINSTT